LLVLHVLQSRLRGDGAATAETARKRITKAESDIESYKEGWDKKNVKDLKVGGEMELFSLPLATF
jgi:guanylate kinase